METKLSTLEKEIKRLRQERDDMEITMLTAIEHGDAIEEQLLALNNQLKHEIKERRLAESLLQKLLDHMYQQKMDLEMLVSTITEHSDEIDNHWLERFSHVEKLSMLDGLTHIANRRAFDSTLKMEWKRCQRNNLPFGIILCDVDWFKRYNDHYGHQQGDDCLIQVAQVVAKLCHRPFDLAARYGGEEFAILLPQTDEEGLLAVAESLRQELRKLAIPHAGSSFGIVSVSQGGAMTIPTIDRPPMELVEAADQQLYLAKKSGRDTFRITSLPHVQEPIC